MYMYQLARTRLAHAQQNAFDTFELPNQAITFTYLSQQLLKLLGANR